MLTTWMNGKVYPWMTWEEIRDEASAGSPIVVPVGSTEQHGPHLPVSTDWVLPTEIVRRAGEQRRLVVGPTVTFGYRSRPGSGGGTRRLAHSRRGPRRSRNSLARSARPASAIEIATSRQLRSTPPG